MSRFFCLLITSILLVGLSTDLAVAQPGGENRPRDMMSFIDRNKNGVIEVAEFDQMPGRFKESLQSFGVDTSRNMSRQEFEKIMPKIIERMRSRRGSSGSGASPQVTVIQSSGGPPGSSSGSFNKRIEVRPSGYDSNANRGRYGSFQQTQDSAPQASSSSKSKSSTESSISKPPRTTVDLNQEFIPHDTDKDGQIGLYEWRKNNPTKLSAFFVMDLNGDGFLTPREIQLSKAGKPQRSAASFMFALTGDEPTEPKSETDKTQTASKKTPAASSVKKTVTASTDPLVNQANYFFKLLDRNKDQTVSSKEWKKSRSMRRMFEGANIDLTQDMSQEQFVNHYVTIKKN
ncbi:MAG: hypothetical protein K0U86_08265 [Planctomycetes bacterium]|nr:hypothetical protein [Planctomycetota bacterium]MCH9724883.1 hypothetical protein [Planctomycetota bacterium]MCH9776842.1 hypothetical protein [Planctomycetota bacterium]MCH9792724.1 hypothetical protein [Planctomycetota bacterium]